MKTPKKKMEHRSAFAIKLIRALCKSTEEMPFPNIRRHRAVRGYSHEVWRRGEIREA
ncbi:mCG1028558, isoform CRA_a [Mus musculus]|jgi:hypothetical protein|nr:mCG1028558, isoform CRA_a [Mus musculus]EDL05185.1 mCG1028558, isoform CRA_a [Mus musculus]